MQPYIMLFRTLIRLALLAALVAAALPPGVAVLAQTNGPDGPVVETPGETPGNAPGLPDDPDLELPANPFAAMPGAGTTLDPLYEDPGSVFFDLAGEPSMLAQGAQPLAPEVDPNVLTEIARLAASGAPQDFAGFSVALSADGSTALVGAYGVDVADNVDQGAAYVFKRTGSTWTQTGCLVAADGAGGDRFGIAVALSGDGHTALVGADKHDAVDKTDPGAAFIFVWNGTAWSQQREISLQESTDSAHLGWAVALSGSGNTAVVGAYNDTSNGFANQGVAYVYERSGTTWARTKTFKLDIAGAYLGYSLAISDDSNTILLGAPGYDQGDKNDVGRAFLYTRKDADWISDGSLGPSDGGADDWFGRSVALNMDGNVALVGASRANISGKNDQGAAYRFVKSGSMWSQTEKFVDSEGAANDFLGVSVSLSNSGDTAIVGAYKADNGSCTDCGKAIIFRKTGTSWATPVSLKANYGSGAQFGVGVAISGDGATVLNGANLADYRSNADMESVA